MWQTVPTARARQATAFGLGGELFIFFCNWGINSIFEQNSSVFHLSNDFVRINQSFSTGGATGADHSFIGGQLFLAFTNTEPPRGNTVVYKFENGEFKEILHEITNKADAVHFYSIYNESFLAICDRKNNQLLNFKWQDNAFEKVQVLSGGFVSPYSATSFSSNGTSFMVVSGFRGAFLYEWNSTHLVGETEVSATPHAFVVHASQSVQGEVFLCVMNEVSNPSSVYRWDNTSSNFTQLRTFTISTSGAQKPGCQLFNVKGNTWGNNDKTDIYQLGSGSFTLYQQLTTAGTDKLYAFSHSGHHYLAVSSLSASNSTVFIWD